MRAPPSDLGVAARLALACFLLLGAFHPGHFRGTDEVGLLQTTRALFDTGSLAVPRMVHTGLGADGRYYSHFSLGLPVLALPFFAAGRGAEALLPEPWRQRLAGPDRMLRQLRMGGSLEISAVGFFGTAMTSLLVALFFLFQRALGTSARSAALCALLLACSTHVASQSTFFLRHSAEATTLLGALFFYFRWKRGGPLRDLWIGSALASLTLLVRFPAAVAGPSLAAYLLWCIGERSGWRLDGPLLRRALPAILVPLAVALALSAGGDWLKWGRPWNVHQLRTASSLHTPLYVSLFGFLLSPGHSVFVYSPLLLMAPWALRRLWRERRAETLVILALCLTFLLSFARFSGWTGLWSAPGPRYLLLAVPLLLLPLGLALDRSGSRAAWACVAGLAVLGVCIQLALMSVSWGGLVEEMRYRESQPKWAFLFMPDRSPVLGALGLALRGERIDLWIHTLAQGAPGYPAAPAAARWIGGLWLAALAASLLWLARGLPAQTAVQPPSTART